MNATCTRPSQRWLLFAFTKQRKLMKLNRMKKWQSNFGMGQNKCELENGVEFVLEVSQINLVLHIATPERSDSYRVRRETVPLMRAFVHSHKTDPNTFVWVRKPDFSSLFGSRFVRGHIVEWWFIAEQSINITNIDFSIRCTLMMMDIWAVRDCVWLIKCLRMLSVYPDCLGHWSIKFAFDFIRN